MHSLGRHWRKSTSITSNCCHVFHTHSLLFHFFTFHFAFSSFIICKMKQLNHAYFKASIGVFSHFLLSPFHFHYSKNINIIIWRPRWGSPVTHSHSSLLENLPPTWLQVKLCFWKIYVICVVENIHMSLWHFFFWKIHVLVPVFGKSVSLMWD